MTSSTVNLHDDDLVVPFMVDNVDTIGRLVRLGPAIDEILTRHAYPDEVSKLLGEALLLVAMFGSMIKNRQSAKDGTHSLDQKERIILQSQTNGPVNLLVADYVHPGHLRGYARFDKAALEALERDAPSRQLFGEGHLAITIDRGTQSDRYQGIVALGGVQSGEKETDGGLAEAANRYFKQSEQLPTFIHLAMAKHYAAKNLSGPDGWHWRGGALMIQKLTSVGGHESTGRDQEGWSRIEILSNTIEDHELLDPLLASPDLLYRLYHEDGVRIFDSALIKATCSCSRQGVANMLANFPQNDQEDMVEEDGKVHITCEFCNRSYEIEPPGAD